MKIDPVKVFDEIIANLEQGKPQESTKRVFASLMIDLFLNDVLGRDKIVEVIEITDVIASAPYDSPQMKSTIKQLKDIREQVLLKN